MNRKTFVTKMPDKTGAFMAAAKIISKNGGNIVRVSYNKAVDLKTLFIDVAGGDEALVRIGEELDRIGYLEKEIPEISVLMVEIVIPDRPGALMPVLKILDRYDVNISYMNSVQNRTDCQNFVMGLLIENPDVIGLLLDELREIYTVNILGHDDSRNSCDNSIFYIRLANEIKEMLGLSQEKTIEFISEANRVLQMLQNTNESPTKVFEAIGEFVGFMNGHRGDNFRADTEEIKLSERVTLFAVMPVCGSNTYILLTADSVVLIDTGYALYRDEMLKIFRTLIPDWDSRQKAVYITHADVDHCGLLSELEGTAVIYLNEKSAESLIRQKNGILDYRETEEFGFGYSKLSRIISKYTPPSLENAVIFDRNTPAEHDKLLKIGELAVADVAFDILEGSGGHLGGEMIYVSRGAGVVFTGDNLVNIADFSEDVKYFNSIAPYLMKSVNVDSKKATRTRKELIGLIEGAEKDGDRKILVCGGHGPVSVLKDGVLEAVRAPGR